MNFFSVEPLLAVVDGKPVYGKDLGCIEDFQKMKYAVENSLNALGARVNGDQTVIFGRFYPIEVLERIAATEPREVKKDFLNFFVWGDTIGRSHNQEQILINKKRDHARAVEILRILREFNLPGAFSQKFKQTPALPGFVAESEFV